MNMNMISKMNARQRRAFLVIRDAAHWVIGGLENQKSDHEEYEDEYAEAVELLNDHDALVDMVYDEMIAITKRRGQDLKFCGKQWLMNMCGTVVASLDY